MERERRELPNATSVLVLGILSIVFFWCYGAVGIIMSIISLALSGSSLRLYRDDPDPSRWIGYENLRAGRVCAIIGLCLSSLFLLWCLYIIFVSGMYFSGLHDAFDYRGI